MNLEELSKVWNSTDEELEKSVKINKALFKEVSMNKIQLSLGEIKLGSFIGIAVSIPFLFIVWSFVLQHYMVWKFLIPGLSLLLFLFLSLGFTGYKLFLYYSINSGESILQTQKNVERLKYLEIMEVRSLYVIIPLLYVIFLIVFAKLLFGYDAYQLGDLLILQGIGSFAVALIVVFFLKKFPNKNLQKSIDFLEEVKEMEGK